MAALGNALEHIGLRLEQGIQEAERELSDLRGRCRALEAEIRTIRAALEAPDAPPSIVPQATDAARVVIPASDEADLIELVEVSEEEVAVSVPLAPPPADPPADPPAESAEPPAAIDTSVSSYMPMLEELWAIARREDDD